MGVYLNPGNEKFAKAVQSEIYVDKTGLIEYTNQVIKYCAEICLCQPSAALWKIYDGGYADGLLWEGMRFQRTFFLD